MKATKFIIGFFMIILMANQGCESFKLDPDDLELNINLDIIKTNVNLSFIDAATQQLIGEDDDTQIILTIYGDDEPCVVDPSGNRMSPYHSSGGFAVLSLDPYKAKPTPEDPVRFTVVATLDGYLSTSKLIRLNREGDFDFLVEMVQLINPPTGVTVKQVSNAGNTSSDGNLSARMEIKTDNDEAKFTINEGTRLVDAKGVPLVGMLRVDFVHFDASKEESLRCFPGGLDVEVINEDGSRQEVLFVSAGFAAIEIYDQTGRKATNFQKGALALDMRIDPGILNPETGKLVAAGDKVPVWSYNDQTGEWKFESNIYVKQTPGGLIGQLEVPHLSSWNLDWFAGSTCTVPIYFKTNDLGKTGWPFNYQVQASFVTGSGYLYSGYFNGTPRHTSQSNTYINTLLMQRVPTNPVRITFTRRYPCNPQFWIVPGPFTENWCAYATNGYEVILEPFGDIAAIRVEVYINCTNNGQRIKPSQTLQARYRLVGSNCWIYKTFSGGETTVTGIVRNSTYEMQAYYQGSWQPSSPHQQVIGNEEVIVFEPAINCGG